MASTSPCHTVPDNGIMPSLDPLPDLDIDHFYSYNDVVMLNQVHAQQMDTSDSPFDCPGEDKVYTSLSDRKCQAHAPRSPQMYADKLIMPENIDIRSWRERHPKHWRTQDITNWIYFVCSRSSKIDRYKIRAENFNTLRGEELCEMTKEQFINLEPNYGTSLHSCFKQLLESAQFKAPEFIDICNIEELHRAHTPNSLPVSDNSAMWSSTIPPEEDQEMDLSGCPMMNLSACHNMESALGTGIAMIGDKQYDYKSDDGFEDIVTPNCGESGYGSDGSTCTSPKVEPVPIPPQAHSNPQPVPPGGPYGFIFPHPSHVTPPPAHVPLLHEPVLYQHHPHQPTAPTKQRGRPKRDTPGQRGRKQGQTTKGNHLWEFIRDTINDNRYNPDHIKWENKEQGIFRIVNSAEIARMWGRTKNNSTMTYEKFSRAMRFCRTQSFFAELPKSGNYPKKLCFKFGTKATNWAH